MTTGIKKGDNWATYPLMDKETFVIPQFWDDYTPAHHALFNQLCKNQLQILPDLAHPDYIDYIKQMGFDKPNGIPKFEDINKKLQAATGWKIVAVPGLVPDEVFFGHLANRRFPVTYWLRSPEVAKYLPEPDIFHDLFGHVPMLMNPYIADFIEAYGKGGLKAAKIDGGLVKITRLYWYTIEFGLINTPDGIRIYGAGILSSETESKYAIQDMRPHRLKFDIKRIMQSDYHYYDLQETYFVIDSYQELVKQTKVDFRPYYEELRYKPMLNPKFLLDSDVIITRGTVVNE
jgi:phenylalanine-4-hydroxylase